MHANHLGSTSVASDASRNQVGSQTYYTFGSTRTTSGSLHTDYTFTGQKLDADAGLLYYGARYYDWILGRFISADTLVPQQFNPQSLNRYSYALNNPVKYTDPTGHWECEEEECERGKGKHRPPVQKNSTEELIEKYRQALQEIKAACQQDSPTCYHKDSWQWIDPMITRDDTLLKRIIEQARKAYRQQGWDVDLIVDANVDNPLDPLLITNAEYPDLVLLWTTWMMLDPFAGWYLRTLGLVDDKYFINANREPLFWITHVVRDPWSLFRAAQRCARSETCWDYK